MHLNQLSPTTHRAPPLPNQTQSHNLRFNFAINGTPVGVRDGLADAITALRALNLSGEEYGSIELVFAEMMNNIVEHAYADTPDGIIQLAIQPKELGLFCTLSDDGHPMPDGAAPAGHFAPVDCEIGDLPEGGFGWFLIRDLARDLEYTRKGDKNILTFRIAVELQHLPVS